MMKDKHSVIFMGTPDFAVPTLKALHEGGYAMPLVITQPDRPRGRGRQLFPSAVKALALEMGLAVFQPLSIDSPEAVKRLTDLAPDFFVVVAYGQILPPEVLRIPFLGPINLHASLLPKYRGPAPIQWAIMHCESTTGVTTMFMDRGVDTGAILLNAEYPIAPEDTAETVHEALARRGAGLVIDTLQGIVSNRLIPRPQDHTRATFAPLLNKADGRIDWHRTAVQLDAFIRAMTPWPGAFCFLNEKRLKIYKARPMAIVADAPPGMIVPGFADELRVATADGVLSIEQIQGASGKTMGIDDFLRGHRLNPGMRFT